MSSRATPVVGEDGEATILVCGLFEYDPGALLPFLVSLPEVINVATGGAEQATWLTTASRLAAAEAQRVGYQAEFAFAKAYKRYFGHGPGAARRLARGLYPEFAGCAMVAEVRGKTFEELGSVPRTAGPYE